MGDQSLEIDDIQQGAERKGNRAMVEHPGARVDLLYTVQANALPTVPNVHDGQPRHYCRDISRQDRSRLGLLHVLSLIFMYCRTRISECV